MDLLHSYVNGNTTVELFDDGTKIRTYEGKPNAIHPESIDVKITDYCDAGCNYCHEQSTKAGKHCDMFSLLHQLLLLPAGVEIAIGGGNPLSHPDLLNFLNVIKPRGIVANITINEKHLLPYQDLIIKLASEKLVNGIGISYASKTRLKYLEPIMKVSDNVVFHMIMGINDVNQIEDINSFCKDNNKPCKILVLGYKQYGFGLNYYLKNSFIEQNKYQWFIKLAKFFKQENITLSFDNLAIKQLELKRFFTDEAWDKFFMGNDGEFTCYMDAVKKEFAKSSTSKERVSFNDSNIIDFFKGLKDE